MPRRPPSSQPKSPFTLFGSAYTSGMIGFWSLSSPGVGGRVHNYAPLTSLATQSAAVVHGIINNPYVGGPAGISWRNQQDALTLEVSDNAAEASGTWVDLGDPIGTNDDATVMVGWIPASTAVPSGTNVGTMFVRGQDGSGAGWSMFLRHDGTNQVTFATVLGGAQQSATGVSAGLNPGIPNYAIGRVRQGSNVSVAVNGRFLVNTATGNTALRTSTKGCRIGTQTSAANTSHCDPIMFVVVWRRALSDAEMMLLTQVPWILWSAPDLGSDTLPTLNVQRDAVIPVDSTGLLAVARDAVIPVDSIGWIARDGVIPVDSLGWAKRDGVIPVDSQGINPFSLAHAWNVRRFFSFGLTHTWNVNTTPFSASLQHNWNVRAQAFGNALTHTWRVLPNIPATFGVNPDGSAIPGTDVQCPVANVTVT